MQFILITNALYSFQNPTTSINRNENFEIQSNELVMTTYIANRNGVLTHGAEIGPPTTSIGVSTPKSTRSRRHTKEKDKRKKERVKKQKEHQRPFMRTSDAS
jgi:hypothetical protein